MAQARTTGLTSSLRDMFASPRREMKNLREAHTHYERVSCLDIASAGKPKSKDYTKKEQRREAVVSQHVHMLNQATDGRVSDQDALLDSRAISKLKWPAGRLRDHNKQILDSSKVLLHHYVRAGIKTEPGLHHRAAAIALMAHARDTGFDVLGGLKHINEIAIERETVDKILIACKQKLDESRVLNTQLLKGAQDNARHFLVLSIDQAGDVASRSLAALILATHSDPAGLHLFERDIPVDVSHAIEQNHASIECCLCIVLAAFGRGRHSAVIKNDVTKQAEMKKASAMVLPIIERYYRRELTSRTSLAALASLALIARQRSFAEAFWHKKFLDSRGRLGVVQGPDHIEMAVAFCWILYNDSNKSEKFRQMPKKFLESHDERKLEAALALAEQTRSKSSRAESSGSQPKPKSGTSRPV